MLEEMRLDHAIRSSVDTTKSPLGRNILEKKKTKKTKKEKKNQNKEKCNFFENNFSVDFF